MSSLLLLVGVLVVAAVLFRVFVQWERNGKEHWAVVFLLTMVVIEAVLYSNQNVIPRSIFHPGGGSLQFRLPEVIITVALLARLAVRGLPRTVGAPALLWAALAGWFVVEMMEGVLRHNDPTTLFFEAKAVVYVVGGYALTAGVSIRRFSDGRGLERFVRWSAAAATLLIVLTLGHKTFNVNLPLLPLSGFGALGTDAAMIFVGVGVLGLVMELAKDHRSRLTLIATVPLVFSALFAFQRAVLLLLAASIMFVVLVAMGSTARRRLRVHLGEVVVTALAVVGVSVAASLIPAITQGSAVTTPFASTISQTLGSTLGSRGKEESAQDRLNKWDVSLAAAKRHPILGQGLGFEYQYFSVGDNQYVLTGITENLELDVFLTMGLVGLLFFLIALGVSLVNGFATWRLHPDRMVAVFTVGLVAVVVGLVAAGQVESIFENYRLATVLGLSLGMLRSAVTSGGGGSSVMRSYQSMQQYEVI